MDLNKFKKFTSFQAMTVVEKVIGLINKHKLISIKRIILIKFSDKNLTLRKILFESFSFIKKNKKNPIITTTKPKYIMNEFCP